MNTPIKDVADLRGEIFRLKELEVEQGRAIGQRFSSPSAIFSTVFSLFSKEPVTGEEKNSGFFHQDIVGLISRIVLPFTLNRTLFRKSNFIIKALVGLASQKASHFITEGSVVSVWDRIKSLIPKKARHAKSAPQVIYGVD